MNLKKKATLLVKMGIILSLQVVLICQASFGFTPHFSNSLTVELTYFDANMVGDQGVTLLWSTSQEQNNAVFVVEKSVDGFTFTEIGKVKGQGNSKGSIQYHFEDPLFEWKAYYRLKQVDEGGSFEYSNAVFIENTNFNYRFDLYPNPLTNDQTLHLEYYSKTNPISHILIYDHVGKLYRKIEEGGYWRVKLDMLPKGFYILAVVSKNGHRETKRFVIEE